jgi:hypothetical protein
MAITDIPRFGQLPLLGGFFGVAIFPVQCENFLSPHDVLFPCCRNARRSLSKTAFWTSTASKPSRLVCCPLGAQHFVQRSTSACCTSVFAADEAAVFVGDVGHTGREIIGDRKAANNSRPVADTSSQTIFQTNRQSAPPRLFGGPRGGDGWRNYPPPPPP